MQERISDLSILVRIFGQAVFILSATFFSQSVQGASDLTIQQIEEEGGLVQLASGLRYKVIREGSGPKPLVNDTVVTHYHGTFLDGSMFDSSVRRGTPATFPVNGVIKGWTEALQLMSVGSKWRLVIPPHLAYGKRGMRGAIPPNATLIFEVELLDIR